MASSQPPPDPKPRQEALLRDAAFFEAIKHRIRDKYHEFKVGDLVKSDYRTYLVLETRDISNTCFRLDNKKIYKELIFLKANARIQKISV